MLKREVDCDDKNKIVFKREARDHDKSIANTMFGVTLGDIVKAVPVLVACVLIYANNENFKSNQMEFNKFITNENHRVASDVSDIKTVLVNLNNYLSANTGKRFKNGEPL